LPSERVDRRLAAVLAADIAGYSRLMGRDEERTLAELKMLRKTLVDPSIASHRGRIVKATGDGMLVEFASAADAARCAVEVQLAMVFDIRAGRCRPDRRGESGFCGNDAQLPRANGFEIQAGHGFFRAYPGEDGAAA
jgi:class 3 adenylate cyclase